MKEFFQKKWVMIAESVLLVAGSVGLTLSGVAAEGVQSLASLAIAGVGAVDAVVTFIAALLKEKK